jgi:hypothetical protein
VLGFTVFAGGKHPNGSRNSGPALESGYLELITFWDRTKAQGAMLAKFRQHIATLFWEQIARIRPETYVADNDYLTFVSGNKSVFASVLDAVKDLS